MKTYHNLISIALAGNPNSGKTTMFNLLTGARHKVGNYPGVTVERKEGIVEYKANCINFIDLPGTYSLNSYSPEELVARKYLLEECPHAVLVVVDSTALERSLYFILQLLEIGLKVIIALNMIDEAEKSGLKIDIKSLQNELGVPIIPTIARTGKGKSEILNAIIQLSVTPNQAPLKINYGQELEQALKKMTNLIESTNFLDFNYNNRTTAIGYLERDAEITNKGKLENPDIHNILTEEAIETTRITTSLCTYTPESIIADQRYDYISALIKNRINYSKRTNQFKRDFTEIIDRLVTNPLFGTIFLCLVLYATFLFATSLSEWPMGIIQTGFDWLSKIAQQIIPNGLLKSLIINGVINGVGSVLSFVPIIGLMFIAISMLEDTGYMARMSYMLDKVFRIFGLHGNSIVALVVSGGIGAGCAVPGVMATRTLRDRKEKIATIITAPMMSCGAKLPVFTVLSAAFFPNHITESLFTITILSWLFVFTVSKLLRSTIISGDSTPFLMELPPYRLPTLKCLILHSWERVWQYIRKAGTVILGVSIILWAAMTYPNITPEKAAYYQNSRTSITENDKLNNAEKEAALHQLANNEAEDKLENSYAGKIGKMLEPISRLAGFDWKINISLVGGLAAKEVIISTLSTAFSIGEVDPEESSSLTEVLKNNKAFSTSTAISLILFSILYAPCFVTVVVIAKEAGVHWALFSLVFNTLLAFAVSATFFQISTHYFNL